MEIFIDRMIKEIVDDEIELKKYDLTWEAKKIYDSLLPDIYYRYSTNEEISKDSNDEYYTIAQIIDEYIAGKKYFDIYYEDKNKNRDNPVLNKIWTKNEMYIES